MQWTIHAGRREISAAFIQLIIIVQAGEKETVNTHFNIYVNNKTILIIHSSLWSTGCIWLTKNSGNHLNTFILKRKQ